MHKTQIISNETNDTNNIELEFKNKMNIINQLTNIIKDPVAKEQFRTREIYKLSLKFYKVLS